MKSVLEFYSQLASDLASSRPEFEHEFICKAANVLCCLSKHQMPDESQPWHLNVLEVTFDTDDESCLGHGGFGSVYRGEWNGVVGSCLVLKLNHPFISYPPLGCCCESDA